MKTIQVRDGYGKVYQTLKNPAVLFDKDSGVLLKIGEAHHIAMAHEEYAAKYREHGHHGMANDLTYLELPLDQELVDNIFQKTGYLRSMMAEQLKNY